MTSQTARPLVITAAFSASLLVGLALLLWAFGGVRGAIAPSAIGGPFQLTDQNGQTVTEQSLKGRPSLVFFGYTHCPDVCPTTLYELSQMLHAMGKDANRVNIYFISVDPDRDTVPVMKDYVSSFDPHIKALTGSSKAVAKVMAEYRVYAKKVPIKGGGYSMDHSALVYLMDRNGQFVAPFNLNQKPAQSAADLKRYL